MRDGEDRTLLLVEDERLVALAQRTQLEQAGYTVVHVESGEAAVEAATRRQEISLVLMDIDLGAGMTGPEAARRILEARRLPIVFLTCHAEQSYVDQVLQITRYGYVLKDSGEFVILQTIRLAFENFDAHSRSVYHEDQLSLLAENIEEVIFTTDLDLAPTYVSPAVETVLGYTPVQFQGVGVQSVLRPESWELFLELVADLRGEGGESVTVELFYVNSLGIDVPLETVLKPFRDSDGVMTGIIGVMRDISDRRAAHVALEKSVQKYRMVVDHAEEAITTFDREGRVVVMNPRAAANLGGEPQDFIGKNLTEFLEGEYGEQAARTVNTVVETGEPFDDEWEVPINGEYRWFRARIYPVRNERGEIHTVLNFSSEITDSKRARLALEESERRYRMLAENASDVVTVFDAEFNIVYLSPSSERLFGFSTEDFGDRSVFSVVHPEDLPSLQAEVQLARAERRESVTHLFRMEDKNGEWHWIESLGRYVYAEDGSLAHLVFNQRDVTERQEAYDRMRRLVSEKEQLMKELNHRVKNNLTMISSLISMKDGELGDRADLRDISGQVRSISMIHEQLQESADASSVDLRQYASAVVHHSLTLFERPARIEIELPSVMISTRSAVYLGILLNEFASNAIKHGFAPDGEAVFHVHGTHDEPEGRFRMEVANSGRPFPAELSLQSPSSLGLRLVSALVDQLAAEIELERTPSARFHLTIPWSELAPPHDTEQS